MLLDFPALSAVDSKSSDIMSRKRTRSRSEDNIFGECMKIQPTTFMYKATPFSDEPEAVARRRACDYSIRITKEMAYSGTAPREIRIFADGAYDLFHQGHARQLQQAKNMFPNANVYLIVGVHSDALLREVKGATVLNEQERYEAVRHCRYVDEVLREAPWEFPEDFLIENKIDFQAHDGFAYANGDTPDIYAHLKEKGMFLATERTEGVSTSDIVTRILKNYDEHIYQNLERGYSAKDLNISYSEEKRIWFKKNMHELKHKGKQIIDIIRERTDDMISKWEEKSKDYVESVLRLCGKLTHVWNRLKDKILNALSPSGAPNNDNTTNISFNEDFSDDEDCIVSNPLPTRMYS